MKNRTLGSVFIVAGTTIGAGMLAMPLAAAGVGFGVTLALLVGLWLLMCYTALLLVEVYQHEQADTGLGTLAKRYLGGGGQWLTSFSMMFLMYALTAAYISGAGELLATSISQWTSQDFPVSLGVLLFTPVAGGVVCIGTHSVDLFNRILFSAKVVFLVVMLGLMLPNIHQTNLMTLPLEQGPALSAIPVIFTSFGFHGSVPSIVNYMGGNIRKLRWVFIIGSAIPLIAYIFWQLATLGSISSDTFVGILAQQAGLNGLLQAVRDAVASPHVELAVHLFADRRWRPRSSAWRSGCSISGRPVQTARQRAWPPANRRHHLPAAAGLCAVLPARLRAGVGIRRHRPVGAGAAVAFTAGVENPPKASGAVSRLGRYAGAGAGVCLWGNGDRHPTGHRQRHAAGGGVSRAER